MLLAGATKENTIVLHGGDFMSSDGHPKHLSFENFAHVAGKLFAGLGELKHFAVIGNHDDENPEFSYARKWLEDKLHIHFLTEPRHAKRIFIHDKSICIHGLHTLTRHLHTMKKGARHALGSVYLHVQPHAQ